MRNYGEKLGGIVRCVQIGRDRERWVKMERDKELWREMERDGKRWREIGRCVQIGNRERDWD